MDINSLYKQLKLLKEEDYIWIIYFFVVIFALISNFFEKEYLLKNNNKDKNIYKTINLILFIVTFFIYLYFVLINIDELKSENENYLINFFNVIGAILYLIAAVIFVITSYIDFNTN